MTLKLPSGLTASTSTLEKRVNETHVWCQNYGVHERYRSEKLQPSLLSSDRHSAVEFVANKRSTLLAVDKTEFDKTEHQGRLLAVYLDESQVDGVAEKVTGGFFDLYDVPPWDTWISILYDVLSSDPNRRTLLLVWIPYAMTERVQMAMNSIVSDYMTWADCLSSAPSERL